MEKTLYYFHGLIVKFLERSVILSFCDTDIILITDRLDTPDHFTSLP